MMSAAPCSEELKLFRKSELGPMKTVLKRSRTCVKHFEVNATLRKSHPMLNYKHCVLPIISVLSYTLSLFVLVNEL